MRGPYLHLALFCALFLLPAGFSASADEPENAIRLSGQQIREALTGNSVAGVWAGRPYRSYFRPDGLTLYKPEGGAEESGKWRVDEVNDQYCSWWARTGWSCYNLYRIGRNLVWEVPESGKRYPSRIVSEP